MARKKEIVLVVDTETAGLLDNAFVYDLGVAAVERTTGRIIESRSMIISDVYDGLPRLMETAYYAEKLPRYVEGLAKGEWEKVNIFHARNIVRNLIRKYDIKRVYAYNVMFDLKALNNTWTMMTKGNAKYFFPYKVKMCCIMSMARQVIAKRPTYKAFCIDNGFLTAQGRPQTSAEKMYAYITNNPDYTEQHTGLEDVKIETEIMHYVITRKKRVVDYFFRKDK